MNHYEDKRNIYFKIAIFTFVAYLFFSFFGTKVPFKPRVEESNLGGPGNLINQVVFSSLFLLSLISLFVRRLDAIAIIKKEKVLTIFLIWCLITVIWSYSPIDTVKRLFRTVALFSVTLSLLVHTSSPEEILKFIKPLLYIYLLVSIIACFTISGAIDPQFHSWRGFEDTKNNLGGVAVICIILSFFIYRMETGKSKAIAAIAVFFSVALLFGSTSVTSISNFMILAFIGSLLVVDELFKPLGLGRAASVIIILFGVGLVVTFLIAAPDLLGVVTRAVGKDPSFTGRTDLWVAMLVSIWQHPFLGTGYQAFWSVTPASPYLEHIYKVFIWLPNEAHNGYIDIANEVGIIGLVIFLVMIIRYFINITKLNSTFPWKWFIIAALINNMQESYLISFGQLPGTFVMIAYLVLYGQLWRQDVEAESE